LLYANIDVVDGKESLFKAKEIDDKVYGRGAADMKFNMAVILSMLEELSNQDFEEKNLGILITSDEELGGINGVKYLCEEKGLRAKCVIGPNGKLDSKKYNLELGCKGTLQTKYFHKGKPSHGSRP